MTLNLNGIEIEDTYAEAFEMQCARAIITADSIQWAREAANQMTGFASSIIACGCEAGVEEELNSTPDGRPGVSVLVFARTKERLARQLLDRVGQCVLTCATTACFNGLNAMEKIPIGRWLRYFGDGFQSSKIVGGIRYWRIPVMEGEFLVEDQFGVRSAVGGGNLLILGVDAKAALRAAEAAVEAMRAVKGIILPFPGGIVRSGSKVGSRYKFLGAATNSAFCPTLRGRIETALPDEVNSAFEIVIDGLDLAAVERAMRVGIEAACMPGVRRISAGNYQGRLGQYKIYLKKVLGGGTER